MIFDNITDRNTPSQLKNNSREVTKLFRYAAQVWGGSPIKP